MTDQLAAYSRGQVRELLKRGAVRVNGIVVKTGRRLEVGDVVEVRELAVELRAQPELPLSVVFEHGALVVVDKPAGMPTVALSPNDTGTLANALLARYPELREMGPPLEAGLLWRLDNDTSGIVVAARSSIAHAAFSTQQERGEIEKTYLALVRGAPPQDSGVIAVGVVHDRAHPERMRLGEAEDSGRVTRYRVLTRGRGHALVECHITRGARHQIRVHLASLDSPIVGDALYDEQWQERPVPRHFLHAARATLRHPVSNEPVTFEAPLPAELTAWWAALRR